MNKEKNEKFYVLALEDGPVYRFQTRTELEEKIEEEDFDLSEVSIFICEKELTAKKVQLDEVDYCDIDFD